MASDLAVVVRGVCKKYGRGKKTKHVLQGITMEVPFNTIFGLLGASGCGKTTLLRCILSSLDPEYGEITVLGMEPGTRSSHVPGRDIGYMPQDVGLIVEFSTFELMMFFGALYRMSLKKIRERVHHLVELLEIPSLHQRVQTMSGGQQRRVSFAVALLQEPSLLILDEPTVGLDPLLRVKIWRHLVDLTTSHQATVIITTHYIEEAKMAHNVGLMRGGVLLAQTSPTALLKMYNTTSLETIFLKLAYKSSQGEDEEISAESAEISTEQSKIKRKWRPLNYHKFQVPKPLNILALTAKNLWKTCKSFMSLVLLVVIPVIQIIFFAGVVGGNVKDVKLLYTNDDHSTYSNFSFSQFYLKNLDSDVFDMEQVSSFGNGKDKISDGDAWATLLFNKNYTLNVVQRYRSTCSDIIRHANATSEGLVENATIQVAVDATNRILTQLSENELFSVANEDLTRHISNVITDSDVLYDLNVNLNMIQFVHGNDDFTFRDFFAPGAAVTVAFSSAIVVSATSLILEREEGMLDRTYVAGVTIAELILSELLLYSIIGIAQVAVIMTIVYAVFNVQMHGNIVLAGFIYWLISLSGLVVGLVISAIADNVLAVIFLASFLSNTPSFFAGVLWPLEGLPRSIRWVSNLMPITYAVKAMKAVVSKGMGIDDSEVYEGILITLGWLCFYLFLVVLIFRR